MKTAVSVPDDLFEEIEQLARRSGRDRSEVYAAALREYALRHVPDRITDALDELVEQLGESAAADAFVQGAARRTLEATEW